MKTSQLIQILNNRQYNVSTFDGLVVDTRPYSDTAGEPQALPVDYQNINSNEIGIVTMGSRALEDYFKANSDIGFTIRIPTFYNRKLFSVDVYTRVERNDTINAWVHSSYRTGDSDAIDDRVALSNTEPTEEDIINGIS